jgi:hypothetical protein
MLKVNKQNNKPKGGKPVPKKKQRQRNRGFKPKFQGVHPTVVLKSRSLIGAIMTGGVFY